MYKKLDMEGAHEIQLKIKLGISVISIHVTWQNDLQIDQ